MKTARILMLGGVVAGLSIAPHVQAQIATQPGTTMTTPRAAERSESGVVPATQLESGANSYTEGQARSRLESNGFSGISNLRKDDNGFWRATATRGGSAGDVALDFQGRIAHGAGVATIGARATGTGTINPVPTTTAPIGSTRMPDGTPGNPPGTAAGRAIDRNLGTNSTGTNPTGTNPTGLNPTGTNPAPVR